MYQSFKGGLGGIALEKMEEAVRSMQRIHMEKKEKAEWQQVIWDRPEKEVPV